MRSYKIATTRESAHARTRKNWSNVLTVSTIAVNMEAMISMRSGRRSVKNQLTILSEILSVVRSVVQHSSKRVKVVLSRATSMAGYKHTQLDEWPDTW